MLRLYRVKVCVVACVAAAAPSLLLPGLASAQAAPPRALTVTVTDKTGGVVTGLRREAFVVLDGGRAREIVSFASGDMPTTVGVLLDASASFVTTRREYVREALWRASSRAATLRTSSSSSPSTRVRNCSRG